MDVVDFLLLIRADYLRSNMSDVDICSACFSIRTYVGESRDELMDQCVCTDAMPADI